MTCLFHDVNALNLLLIGSQGMDPHPVDGRNDVGYQMIPFGGTRNVGFMSLSDETEDIISPTHMGSKSDVMQVVSKTGPMPVKTPKGWIVKPNSTIELILSGRNVGRAAFEARHVDKPEVLWTLMVSVKTKRPLSYQLCVLSDPLVRLDPTVAGPALMQNMLAAEPIWLDRANVELARVGPILDVQTSFAIGNPVYNGNPIELDEDKVAEIVRATNATAGVQRADIHMYAVWDLRPSWAEDTVGQGDKIHRLGWLESHLTGRHGAAVAAHEIGHILKLEHPPKLGADITRLMDGYDNTRLTMLEIETTNP